MLIRVMNTIRKDKIILFSISKGVTQGGILSPIIFLLFMDDLSKLLINYCIGCFIDKICFKRVFYANDLCLSVNCAIALRELLQICHNLSRSVDVKLNTL